MAEAAGDIAMRKIVEDRADAVRRLDMPAVRFNEYAKTWELIVNRGPLGGVFQNEAMTNAAGGNVAFVTALMHCAGEHGQAERRPGGAGRADTPQHHRVCQTG